MSRSVPEIRRVAALSKVLILRPDRIGDVIVSTPVLKALKLEYPEIELHILVRPSNKKLVSDLPEVDRVIEFEPEKARQPREWFRWIRFFKSERYEAAIFLYPTRLTLWLVWLAGISVRVGPLTKPHTRLLLNHGVKQDRYKVELHEAEYGLKLLEAIGVTDAGDCFTSVSLRKQERCWARKWLTRRSVDPEDPIVFVHPGMGDSALNWPLRNYADLISQLHEENWQIVITAGPRDNSSLTSLRQECRVISKIPIYNSEIENGNHRGIEYLTALFSFGSCVVAPSTGPLHIAVALNVPVITFYAPVRVMSAKRWGPYVENTAQASVFEPEVNCGQTYKCIGSNCGHFPCMETLTVAEAKRELLRFLERDRCERLKH